jgi:glycosyltransferase involved in cell wall biosynthesis
MKDNQSLRNEDIELCKKYVRSVFICRRERKSQVLRIFNEITLKEFYFNGWKYSIDDLKFSIGDLQFDVIWFSPITVIDALYPISQIISNEPILIAGINDSTTALFRNNSRRLFIKGATLESRTLSALGLIRSLLIRNIEAKILNYFDIVLVQTPADKKWLDNISKGSLSKKIVMLSNGVDDTLFELPISLHDDILYLANLEGEYSDIAIWLIDEVWPRICEHNKNSNLVIVGKGANDRIRSRIMAGNRIAYFEFIENLSDVFKGKGLSVAPSFKTYGLINKVIESMAAGVPVVGDKGSFNGISGFENMKHGVVANGTQQTVEAVSWLLKTPEARSQIARSGRELIRYQFSWRDRIRTITDAIINIRVSHMPRRN